MGRHRRSWLLLALAALALPATASAAARPWPAFAPYVDQAGWPPPNLEALRTGAGIRHVTLGFVVARGGSECVPTWGGYPTYPATGAGAYRRAQVTALRRHGGSAIVSFGGQAGTELAAVCPTAAALTDAYQAVIDAYGATRIDFDIEGAAVADPATNARRMAAIAALQRRAGGPRVSLTLPVLPDGLDANGRATLRAALTAGVRVTVVNVMAMDYGDSAAPNPAGRMGTFAIQAAQATARQLRALQPKLSAAAALRRVGVTPMIGINDVATEVFTLADARQLATWARRHHLGLLSMWEAGRDRECAQPTTSTQIDCSGVDQPAWAFSKILG